MQNQSKLVVSLLAAACALPLAVAAMASTPLHAAGPIPVVGTGAAAPGALVTAERIHVAVDHAPVAVSWALPANKPIDANPKPYQRVSRQFLIDATGAELQRGVALPLTAAGDIVRISPLGAGSAAVESSQISLATGGHKLTAMQASKVLASGVQMQQVGVPIQRGSTVLKLADSVKAGPARLTAHAANGNYLVQVYEPQSPFAMTLAANRGTNVAGQAVKVAVAFLPSKASATGVMAVPKASLERVTGVLQAPDGWSEPVRFAPGADGSYVADITPPAAHAGERGLWEIHAFASGRSGNQTVLREATNAFAVVLPTARLSRAGLRVVPHAGRGVSIDVGVDVAAASRYAVSGVLYGHTAKGQLEPAAYAQSAAWLQPGRDVPIRLTFDATALAKSRLHAPFQLRDLSLEDQTQLGVLDSRALAARGLVAGR